MQRLRGIKKRPDELLDLESPTSWQHGEQYALFHQTEFLARHAGEVLGRQRISEKVWDANYDPASNIIDVYVARLRRKVDGAGDVPLLHTVRGAGYVLDPDRQS